MNTDFVIRNGHVIDPANGLDEVSDVYVKAGTIQAVGKFPDISVEQEYDATGCIVTPGLIDLHVHGYEHCTPLGIDVDRWCIHRGVTTAVDAGSAGAGTFNGLRKFIAEQIKTRLFAFVHIASHGLATAGLPGFGIGGECDSLNQVDPDLCLTCLKNNPDLAIGVKVRLSSDICKDGEYEKEVYRRALSVTEMAGVPLMTHHTCSTIPVAADSDSAADSSELDCPVGLRPGDIYTHCFFGGPSSIVDPNTLKVILGVKEAQKRGVMFDIGHGVASFSWNVGEICSKEEFWPDTISSDLHSGNFDGPVYDLLTCMSKMLHLGMPLKNIIKATTETPARAIGKSGIIGSLTPSTPADISLIKLEQVSLDLEDSQGQKRRVKKLMVPVAVWKDGMQHSILDIFSPFPNVQKTKELVDAGWETAVIKDAKKPVY